MFQNQKPGDPVVFVHMLDQNGVLLVVEGIKRYRHGTDILRSPAAKGCAGLSDSLHLGMSKGRSARKAYAVRKAP